MASTYEKIQTTTISSATSALSFTSISSAYTDLILAWAYKSNSSNNPTLKLTFNGNSTDYSGRQMGGNGVAPSSNNTTSATSYIALARLTGGPTPSGETALMLLHVMDYTNSGKYKSIFCQFNSASTGGELDVGVWANNAAINRIDIDTSTSTDFAVGSVITLYGIKAA